MNIINALNHLADKHVGAKDKGVYKVFISDGQMSDRLVLVVDAEKLTFSATDNKYGWVKTGDEAGYALSIALMSGYEVVELAWKGTDRITGLASYMKFDETANEWHDL